MKVTIEEREFEIKANGLFMKTYHDLFGTNMVVDLYNAMANQNVMLQAQLIYCSISGIAKDKKGFEKWLESFESPLFPMTVFDDVYNYILQGITPTVEPKVKDTKSTKKKTTTK